MDKQYEKAALRVYVKASQLLTPQIMGMVEASRKLMKEQSQHSNEKKEAFAMIPGDLFHLLVGAFTSSLELLEHHHIVDKEVVDKMEKDDAEERRLNDEDAEQAAKTFAKEALKKAMSK